MQRQADDNSIMKPPLSKEELDAQAIRTYRESCMEPPPPPEDDPCPNCGHPAPANGRENPDECPACGVIKTKFRQSLRRPHRSQKAARRRLSIWVPPDLLTTLGWMAAAAGGFMMEYLDVGLETYAALAVLVLLIMIRSARKAARRRKAQEAAMLEAICNMDSSFAVQVDIKTLLKAQRPSSQQKNRRGAFRQDAGIDIDPGGIDISCDGGG